MKKIFTPKVLILSLLSVVIMAAGTAVKYSGGAPVSHTNAPGEQECTACHGGSLNPTPSNLANLTLTIPFTGNGYLPDSTYSVNLKYLQNGINRFGFQITALAKSNNQPVGTFTAGTGSSKLTGTVLGKTREYLTHNGGAGSSAGKGEWNFTWKAPSTNVDTIVFYVVINAANSDGGTSGDQIYAKTFDVAPSTLLPKATITINKTEVCAGDTLQFFGSGTNTPTSWAWKFKTGTPTTSTQQNPKIVFNIPGNYIDTLRVKNAKGESAPAVVSFKVISAPIANIASVSPGNTVCEGDTITLSATFGAGYKYEWNTGNPADTFSTVKITKQGNYSVTVTNSTGCSKTSASTNLVFKPLATGALTFSRTSVCEGDTILVMGAGGGAGAVYNFYQNKNLIYTGTNTNVIATLNQNDTFELTIEENGCTSIPVTKISNAVSKLAAPVITCGTSTTSSVTFNWGAVTGATGYEVSLDTGKNWSAPSTGSSGLSHTINGLNFNTNATLWVRATDNAPCLGGNVNSFTCKTLTCSGVTFGVVLGDSLLCPGDSTTITVSNISVPNYSLQFGAGNFASDTVFWVKPSQTTKFPFALIDSNAINCPAVTFDVDVNVDVIPALTVSADNGTTICDLDPVSLTTTGGNANVAVYTVFINNSQTFYTNTTGVFTNVGVGNNNKLFVQATTLEGCTGNSNEITFTVNPLPTPGFTSTINNRVVDFDDTTSTTASRVWNFGDNSATSTVKTPNHTFATVGTFNVKLIVTDGNGCIDSTTQPITTQNLSVNNIVGLGGLDIYPNPTKGMLKLGFEWYGEGAITLSLTDVNGRVVWTDEVTETGNHNRTVNLSDYANGTYLLRLQTTQGEHTLKVLKTE